MMYMIPMEVKEGKVCKAADLTDFHPGCKVITNSKLIHRTGTLDSMRRLRLLVKTLDIGPLVKERWSGKEC